MHHLKYLLIILASSFLLMSCSDEKAETPSTTPTENEDSSTSLGNENSPTQNPDPSPTSPEGENSQAQDSSSSLGNEDSPTTQNPDPSPTSPEDENSQVQSPFTIPMDECIKGVYNGSGDFTRYGFGQHPYKLEVNYNSNEIIFLLTNLSRELEAGSQACTIYQDPYFDSTEDSTTFTIQPSFIQGPGGSPGIRMIGNLSDTSGIFSIKTVFQVIEEPFCRISEFKLFRPGDDFNNPNWLIIGTKPPTTNPSRVTNEELRSFDELKSDCDALDIYKRR